MRRLIFILVILLIVGSTSSSAYADGMVLRVRSDYTSLANEKSQTAIIYFERGLETLFLKVDIESERDELFWVFPVPVSPDKAKIDIREMVRISQGRDIIKAARGAAEDARNLSLFTQLYPRLIFPGLFTDWEPTDSFETGLGGGHSPAKAEGVTVHQSVTRFGMTSELISADSIVPLVEYLETSSDKLPDEATQALQGYLDGGYSFVVTKAALNSVGEEEALPEHISPSVQVKFPTNRIFFPLKLTSGYRKRVIPLELTVEGYVTPKFPRKIKKFAETYYFNKQKAADLDFENFTFIRVAAASDLYTDDLWMTPRPPFFVAVANVIARYPVMSCFGQFILLSVLCSITAGIFAFPGKFTKQRLFQLSLLALSNFLTVIAVFIVAHGYAYNYGFTARNALKFTIIFSLLFVVINLADWGLLISIFNHHIPDRIT